MKRMLLAGAALLAASLLPAAGQAQDTVKIGVICLFRPVRRHRHQIDNGIKLYMKQHGDTSPARRSRSSARTSAASRRRSPSGWPQELVVRDNVDILAGFALTPNALAGRRRLGRRRRNSW